MEYREQEPIVNHGNQAAVQMQHTKFYVVLFFCSTLIQL